ncbi:MAG: AlkA N-terminal domain-containing protein [Acidobacteriota bacterium]
MNEGSASRPLQAVGPFHLQATVRVLQRRPTNRVDIWEDGCHRRALSTPDGVLLVETRNLGSVDDPQVRFAILNGKPSRATQGFVAASLRRMLGLDVDPTSVQRLAERVRGLRPTALALRGMRPPRFPSLFEAFGSVIPFQQLSLDAGVSIVGRMVDRFGATLDLGGERWHAFPEPAVVAEAGIEALKSGGLSLQKAETLRRVAGQIASRELTEERLAALSTRDALAELMSIPGVGPWTAAVVLLRGLGRTDVFPPNDTGVARGLGALLERKPGPTPAAVIGRFGEQRGYLYFYSLGAQLISRGLIDPAPRVRHLFSGRLPLEAGRRKKGSSQQGVDGSHPIAGRVGGRKSSRGRSWQ